MQYVVTACSLQESNVIIYEGIKKAFNAFWKKKYFCNNVRMNDWQGW